MTLNKWQVLHLIKPQTDLSASDKFRTLLHSMPNGSCSGSITIKWYDFSKYGGLGHFGITATITVSKSSNGHWAAHGVAYISDYWDFNWSVKEFTTKEWKRGVKTALGSTISGDPFWINSVWLNISQMSGQKYTEWK